MSATRTTTVAVHTTGKICRISKNVLYDEEFTYLSLSLSIVLEIIPPKNKTGPNLQESIHTPNSFLVSGFHVGNKHGYVLPLHLSKEYEKHVRTATSTSKPL